MNNGISTRNALQILEDNNFKSQIFNWDYNDRQEEILNSDPMRKL